MRAGTQFELSKNILNLDPQLTNYYRKLQGQNDVKFNNKFVLNDTKASLERLNQSKDVNTLQLAANMGISIKDKR